MVHIVIDLEMNPVRREHREIRRVLQDEIIEFGAVKLNEYYVQIEEFQSYVKPEYGSITKRITELTGITAETVADKSTFADAFKNFFDWIGTWDMKIYSWSLSDLNQLKSECSYKLPEFDVRRMEKQWIDIQQKFDEKIGLHTHLALRHAVGAMNRNFEGVAHTALADAANTAAILSIMQDDEIFHKTMKPVIDLLKPQELSESIGDLYPELMNMKFD